jgi:hypothetical protein
MPPRVDPHTVGCEFEGETPSELIDGGLAHAVGEHTGECTGARYAGNIDDGTLAVLEKRYCEPAEVENGPQVDVHHAVPLVEAGGLCAPGHQDARSVDEDVQSAQATRHHVDERPPEPGVGEIARDGQPSLLDAGDP